jgi:hypothetical protein
MSSCPACSKNIFSDWHFCAFCGQALLDSKPPLKWYFKKSILIVALLSVGPLALPLVWFHPQIGIKSKVIISIFVIVLTYYSSVALIHTLKVLSSIIQDSVPS